MINEDQLDINKLAAEFLSQNLDKYLSDFKLLISNAIGKHKAKLNKTYSLYLTEVSQRYAKAKSFFIRTEPTFLKEFYIPLDISRDKTKISSATLNNLIKISNNLIISGTAGCGKSLMMRYLLLNSIEKAFKIPVFIELRNLNDYNSTLRSFIDESLQRFKLDLTSEYIDTALENGQFLFLFDGFDEVVIQKKADVATQISNMSDQYNKNWYIVSSRPDREFSGWQNFTELSVEPLTLKKACLLVEKLQFDSEIKVKFITDLKENLYQKHESFLSNPLLLSIMLITYGLSASIPNKLSIFFSQAYEALFERHDALKAGFQRDRRTMLDIQEFARVFSSFCVITYDKREFQFGYTDAINYLDLSKKFGSTPFNSSDFLKDLLKAVCLLVEDGLQIVFSHRSFQEYFVACFIRDASEDIQRKLLQRFSRYSFTDNILLLLWEMKPYTIERYYILPEIESILSLIKATKHIGITHYTRFIKNTMSKIHIRKDHWSIHSDKGDFRFFHFLNFINDRYTSIFGNQSDQFDSDYFNMIFERHANGKTELNIFTKNLTYRDEFLIDFSKIGGFYSHKSLQNILILKNILIKKHKTLSNSIEKLLLK